MDSLIAFWYEHWDAIVHYVGVVVPWIVDTKLRFLSILLAWPAVVLYLGLLFLLLFRVQLAAVLTRVKEVTYPGGVVSLETTKLEETKPPSAPPPEPALTTSQAAQPDLELRLTKYHLEMYEKAFASLAEQHYFESALNVILGSQWRFLYALKASAAGFFPGVAYGFFVQHQHLLQNRAFPTFELWLQWMQTNEFISFKPNPPPAMYIISEKGRKFVDYVEGKYRVGADGPARLG